MVGQEDPKLGPLARALAEGHPHPDRPRAVVAERFEETATGKVPRPLILPNFAPCPSPASSSPPGNPGKGPGDRPDAVHHYDIVGLDAIGCTEDIPETAPTIPGNAIQKAIRARALRGPLLRRRHGPRGDRAGWRARVHTARYAGEAKDADANMAKLLDALEGRRTAARFRTVIALTTPTAPAPSRASAKGHRGATQRDRGFGTTRFRARGRTGHVRRNGRTPHKNAISHRGRAVRAMVGNSRPEVENLQVGGGIPRAVYVCPRSPSETECP